MWGFNLALGCGFLLLWCLNLPGFVLLGFDVSDAGLGLCGLDVHVCL